jgi:hypothetical protein
VRGKRSQAKGFGKAGESERRSDWTIFWFQASPIEFEHVWMTTCRGSRDEMGGSSMSYETAEIFKVRLFQNDNILNAAASNALLDAFSNSLRVGARPSVQAPDRPSSTH